MAIRFLLVFDSTKIRKRRQTVSDGHAQGLAWPLRKKKKKTKILNTTLLIINNNKYFAGTLAVKENTEEIRIRKKLTRN